MLRSLKTGSLLILPLVLNGCSHVIPGWTEAGLASLFVASTVPEGEKPEPYAGVLTQVQRNLNAEDSYSLGEIYYNSGYEKHYPIAFELFQQAASQNHTYAKARLGWMLLDGIGGPKNVLVGLDWLEQAAAEGNEEVKIILGNLYLNGDEGVERDIVKAKQYYQEVLRHDTKSVDAMIGLARAYEATMTEDANARDIAIRWYTEAGRLGSVEAKFRLATLYSTGPEAKRDYERSVKLFKEVIRSQQESAYHGDESALLQLGDLYAAGLGVPKNDEKAAQFYEAAAQDGSAKAAFSLGTLYEFGDGRLRDFRKALSWYRKSIELGYVYAAYRVGLFYEEGKGTRKDLKQANKFYKLASDGGVLAADAKLADHYMIGRGLPQDLKKAADYYYKLAVKDDPFAQYMLSNMFRTGYGLKKDVEASIAWKFRADKLSGNGIAKAKMGEFYLHGRGVLRNPEEAHYWFKAAADQEVPSAQWQIGQDYYMGNTVPKDLTVAADLFQKAAKQGYAEAKYSLGVMAYNGEGAKEGAGKDKAKAAEYFKDAADQGLPHAQYRLAQMYYDGDGVTQSNVDAYAWWALSEKDQFEGVRMANKLMDKMRPEDQDKAIKLAIQYRRDYMSDSMSN